MTGRKPPFGPKQQLWDRPGRLIGILWQLAEAGDAGQTIGQLREVYGVSARQISRDLITLERARIRLIHRGGQGRGIHGRWYLATEADRAIAKRLAVVADVAPSSTQSHSLRRLSA